MSLDPETPPDFLQVVPDFLAAILVATVHMILQLSHPFTLK
jgi:hypothetical protein